MSDPKADRFAELYDAHFPRLVAYCRRRVDAQAVDDLVADVFLAAWRRINDAPPVDEALPWLYRIAYNTTGNHWRGRDRRRRLTQRLAGLRPSNSRHPVTHQIESREELAHIVEVAGSLRFGDIEVLRLAYWEELSVSEIGEVVGVSANTAKQRLRRARTRLKDAYEESTGIPALAERAATEGGTA